MADPPLSPKLVQAPPERLVQRTGHVTTGITNTIRLPHDRFIKDRTNEWFTMSNPPVGPGMKPIQKGNDALFLVQGDVAIPEMAAAIQTATAAGHFIFMLNWYCDVDLNFGGSNVSNSGEAAATTNLRELLTTADSRGVMIRAMFWHQPLSKQNLDAILFLNSLVEQVTPNGPGFRRIDPKKDGKSPLKHAAAIFDNLQNKPLLPIPVIGILPHVGSHHQKLLAVNGNQGLVCFCGGVDWNPDRIRTDGGDRKAKPGAVLHGNPLHDVHCRVIGPAARDLVQVFFDRWNGHPEHAKVDQRLGPLPAVATPSGDGPHVVQIGRTFGHDGFHYPHAPDGEQTLAQVISTAIRNAKRFLYTECQYFVGSPALTSAVLAALPNIEHFTVVLTHWEISDLPLVNKHRTAFINQLKSVGGEKVRIFTLQPNGNTPAFQQGHDARTYVHAKIWIVDDEFASIGSPNANRRGWSHDNEMVAGIYDPSNETVLTNRFAHLLRMKLWHQHLSLEDAELVDGLASAVHWLKLPAGARVQHYNPAERNAAGDNDIPLRLAGGIPIIGPALGPLVDPALGEAIWNEFLDPA